MKGINQFFAAFKVYQNVEYFFEQEDRIQKGKLVLQQVLIICIFTFLYGAVMGSYHSLLQSITSGIKVTFLFLCSLFICFPSFFVIQHVLGSKMTLNQMLFIVLSGFVLTSVIALSFTPVVILFQITGGNYHFLQLLHVAIFIFAGIFGMRLMIEALKYACEKKNIYPHTGVNVFRIWIIILAFVGIQLSWNLRPFLLNQNEDYKLFRQYEGNFYTAIVYSIKQLTSPPESAGLKSDGNEDDQQGDARVINNDSTLIRYFE